MNNMLLNLDAIYYWSYQYVVMVQFISLFTDLSSTEWMTQLFYFLFVQCLIVFQFEKFLYINVLFYCWSYLVTENAILIIENWAHYHFLFKD